MNWKVTRILRNVAPLIPRMAPLFSTSTGLKEERKNAG